MADETQTHPLDVELLESVIDYLPIGAIIVDDDGIIQRFNRHEEQLSGLDREETIGKSFFSDIAPCTKDIDLGPRFREGIEDNNLDIDVEFSFPYPYNRVPRDVHIRAVSVESDSDHAHVILIEDITSKRQLERSNADMMVGLKTMISRWRGGGESGKDAGLAFGSSEAFEERAVALYADVSGFSEIASRTPPAQLFQVVDRQLRTAIEVISSTGGHIDQVNGNGVIGVYMLGQEGERAFYDAVKAAWDIVEKSSQDLELPFRVGLALGSIYNGPIGHDEFGNRATVGSPLSVARSLSQTGRPHEIIVTDDIVGRLDNAAATTALKGTSPMGVPDPGTIHRIESLDLPSQS